MEPSLVTGGRFSLLLPFYAGDRPDFLRSAFTSSVHDQKRRPDEVVLVQDGAVDQALADEARVLVSTSPVAAVLVQLPQNLGLSAALEAGLAACSYDIVARMDADDISLPSRFSEQMSVIEAGADLVGGGMLEFSVDVAEVITTRRPPVGADAIAAYSRFHDPFNHPTVVYRRSAVARAGGYRALGLMEDYWLFARMIHSGARVENLAQPVLMYRVGSGAYERRGGLRQFKAEWTLQREFRKMGFTSNRQWLRNVLVRGGYRFVPVAVRKILYRAYFGARL